MRSSYALRVLIASGGLFFVAIFTPVHGLPQAQNSLPVESPSGSPSPQSSNQSHTYMTPAILIALILFIAFASLIIALFFFASNLRAFVLRNLGRQEKPKLGFGFDGLSRTELKQLRLKEEEEAMKTSWFTKLPAKPPALVLKHPHSPLLPIQLPSERGQVKDSQYKKFDGVEERASEVGMGIRIDRSEHVFRDGILGQQGTTS